MQSRLILLGVVLSGLLTAGRALALTDTPTETPTLTITTTLTITLSPTATVSVSGTATDTCTPSATPTCTLSPTVSASPIFTQTPTLSPTNTPTCSVTSTPTVTNATTAIATLTPTRVYTMTATPTRSGAQATATTTLTLQSFTSPVTIRQNVIRPSLQQPVFISIHLEKNEHVAVKIYNRQGQLIRTLYDQLADAGSFDLAWQGVNQNGNVVGSGIYFIDIKTDSFEEKRKVAVVK